MGNLRRWGFLLFVGIILFSLGSVYALDSNYLISNSENWEDVYSTLLFAKLNKVEASFLTSTPHGPLLLNTIPEDRVIQLVNSPDNPFVFNYESMIESRGYAIEDSFEFDSANLGLIDEMPDIKNFVIVDDSYGYSAIAVAPYAILTNSWVFFANRVNIAEIESIMNNRDVDQVLVYGYVEREVNDAMEKYSPKIINTGDRFKDNIAIVEEFKKLKETQQVLLSNGEFIEKELMSGTHPILFTGRTNVPNQIASYLKDSDITVGVLIGNELINAATNIRRSAGISVMVKFAQGARVRTSGVSAVEGLDLFYLPTPTLDLEVYSVKYNRASSQIEVTYHSKSNVPIYLKGTLTATSDDEQQRVGDLEPVFMAPEDYKTLTYPEVVLTGENLELEFFTLFGEVPTSMDYQLSGKVNMSLVNIIDKCDINVNYVKYNKQTESFFVKVKNKADTECYVDIEFHDIMINEIDQIIGSEGSKRIKAGGSDRIEIEQRMTPEDIDDNPFINLVAYYGEREDSLVKTFKGKFELEIERFTKITYAIIIIVILLILLAIYLWKLKRNDEW